MAKIEGAGRMDLHTLDPENVVIPEDGPLFDERNALPVDEYLVNSIMYQGVLEPILVRKNGPAIEVVAGRQRVKATREANRRFKEQGKRAIKIPCILKSGSDAEMFGIMISENEIRQDDEAMVKAEKAKRLLNYGNTLEEICTIFGKDKRTVEGWIALAAVAPEVQDAIRKGEIAAGVGVALADIPRAEQAAKLNELKKTGKATVKQAQREVRAEKQRKVRPESRPGRPPALPMPPRKELHAHLDELTDQPAGDRTPQVEGFITCLEYVTGALSFKDAVEMLR